MGIGPSGTDGNPAAWHAQLGEGGEIDSAQAQNLAMVEALATVEMKKMKSAIWFHVLVWVVMAWKKVL